MARRIEVELIGDSRSLERAFGRAQASSGTFSRALGKAALAASGAFAGGLVLATKSAIDFDRSMRNVNSIARLSETRFRGLSRQVLALAKETGQGPKTLADGLYDIVSSGFKANDAIKVLRASAKAATAGMTNTAVSAAAVSAALNAYHLEASQARKVSDVLFQTVNKGVLTFEELAQNMGDLVPAAAPLGVRLEEVGAAMATVTLQGVPAAEAATRVKNTMLQLAKPSKAMAALLKENGFESGEAAVKAKGFAGVLEMLDQATKGSVTRTAALTPEIRALMGVVGLTGKNLETYNANLRAMDNASKGAGATSRAFAEQGKSIAFQWQRAKASLIAAAIPIGQLLFPALAAGAEKVGEFAQRVQREMPRIRAEFNQLAGSVTGVANGLAEVGRSRQGQIALAGLASAFIGGKAAAGVAGFALSLRGLNPWVAAVTVGVGLLGAAFFASVTSTTAFERATLAATRAARELTGALNQQRQAHLTAQQAAHAVEAAELGVEAAQKNVTLALREFGKGSLQHRQALVSVKQATDNLAQAKQNLRTATKNSEKADNDAAAASKRHGERLSELRAKAEAMRLEATAVATRIRETSVAEDAAEKHARALGRAMEDGIASEYGKAIGEITRALGGTKREAREARNATVALGIALGRLPTQKEVNIIIREQRRDARRARLGATPRAGGGFIPMMAGASRGRDSVPALLTPGEMVLNRTQQNALGGPGFLADLFGFVRPLGFQGGGVAPPPHMPRFPRQRRRIMRRAPRAGRKGQRAVRRIGRVGFPEEVDATLPERTTASADLPAVLEESIFDADASGNTSAMISARRGAIAWLEGQLSFAGTPEERLPIKRAIKGYRDEIADLSKAPEPTEDERAQLAQTRQQLTAAQRALQLQTAGLAAGLFPAAGGGGGAQLIFQSLIPDAEGGRRAAEIMARLLGAQAFGGSSVVAPGI